MDKQQILSYVDHTKLNQDATFEDIKILIDDAIQYGTKTVCIPPCYVQDAKKYAEGKMEICTVIGFPNGNMTTQAKVLETIDALKNGANEIDMVINIGMLKANNTDYVLNEIKEIKAACGTHVLKVIIETCLLTEEEKITMCHLVTEAKADFIKTSTGFSKGGATFDDIALFKKHVGKDVCIKAAGGISSFDDAQKFIALGATRLGTSRLVAIMKKENNGQAY